VVLIADSLRNTSLFVPVRHPDGRLRWQLTLGFGPLSSPERRTALRRAATWRAATWRAATVRERD